MNNLTKLIIAVLTPTQLLAEPIELDVYTKVLDYSKYLGKSWVVEATVDGLGTPIVVARSPASSIRDLGQVDPGKIYLTIGCEVDRLIVGIITTTHRVINPEVLTNRINSNYQMLSIDISNPDYSAFLNTNDVIDLILSSTEVEFVVTTNEGPASIYVSSTAVIDAMRFMSSKYPCGNHISVVGGESIELMDKVTNELNRAWKHRFDDIIFLDAGAGQVVKGRFMGLDYANGAAFIKYGTNRLGHPRWIAYGGVYDDSRFRMGVISYEGIDRYVRKVKGRP